jgi:riboflavin kinase/FMN adenylyltransferase
MTFEPPPEQVLRPDSVAKRITPVDEKVRLLVAAGCDRVVVVGADREFLATEPDEFIRGVIVRQFAPAHVVEGENFMFGRSRAGNVETLREASARSAFEMHVVAPLKIDLGEAGPRRVSSTLIRSLIESGLVDQASRCLGRDYAMFGKVVRGTGRGRELLGFPTINLDTGRQVIPADGVYAGRATVAGETFAAAVSVGDNPTLGGGGRSVEAFLLDVDRDFRGCDVAMSFVRRIGPQEKFDSPEALKQQIARDVEHVREIIG